MINDQIIMLVDEKDKFLGYEKKEVCHTGPGKHHRAIAVFLFNNKGETLLQKRKHKRWNNVWDTAGATHPLRINGRDETYEECGARFLRDEWGTNVPLKKLFGFNYFERYDDMCENEFCVILVGTVKNEKIKPNPEVAYGYDWVSMKHLLKDVKENPGNYTPWAIIAVKEFANHPAGKKYFR